MRFRESNAPSALIQHLLEFRSKEGLNKAGLAAAIGVKPSMVSQVLSGKRKLSLDQAFQAAEYLGLEGRESEYLLKLVELTRASNGKYRRKLEAELDALRNHADMAVNSSEARSLSDSAKAVFYSDWCYSAVHLQLFAKPGRTKMQLAELLALPPAQVESVLAFLAVVGLARKEGKAHFAVETSTHLPEGSPYRLRHHLNWRAKASMHISSASADTDFFLSCPMVLSQRDAQSLREKIRQAAMEIRNQAVESGNEVFVCMNIDWFGL